MKDSMRSNVTLRPIDESDAPIVQRHVSDERIASTCNVPYPYPENGAVAWIRSVVAARKESKRHTFTILSNHQFAGVVDLKEVNMSNGTSELGYWIAVPFWNRGVATEAAHQAICFAFRELGLMSLTSHCLVRNPASARVLEKSGFRRFDEFVDETPDSRFRGECWQVYRLTKEEWERGCEVRRSAR